MRSGKLLRPQSRRNSVVTDQPRMRVVMRRIADMIITSLGWPWWCGHTLRGNCRVMLSSLYPKAAGGHNDRRKQVGMTALGDDRETWQTLPDWILLWETSRSSMRFESSKR